MHTLIMNTLIKSRFWLILSLVGMTVFELSKVRRVCDMSSVVVFSFVGIFGNHVMTELHRAFSFCVLFVEEIDKDVSITLDEFFRVSLSVFELFITISLDSHEKCCHLRLMQLLQLFSFLFNQKNLIFHQLVFLILF